MQLPRRVQDELLDGLAATDPVAERSRRDLQRVHRFMRTRTPLVRNLRRLTPSPGQPLRVLELGAGDGTLLLGVARELAPVWPSVELTLLDRQALVDDTTVADYARCGWTARSSVMDVLDWADVTTATPSGGASRWDVSLDVLLDQVGYVGHQKYPSCFFFSMDADWSWSMTRPWRSELVVSSISWMIAGSVSALLSIAPVSG